MDLGVAIGVWRRRLLLLVLRARSVVGGGRGAVVEGAGGLVASKRTGWHSSGQRDGVGTMVAGSFAMVRQQPRRLVGSHLRAGTVLRCW